MELLEKISQSFTQKGRLLTQLATFTGQMQGLADRLTRHGEACVYPQMKEKIEAVAIAVKAQVKTLNAMLSDNRVWARLPEMPVHQGINNWERLSGDLILLGRLNSELNQHAVRWLAADPDISQRLRSIAEEQIAQLDALQEVAARSDPQALD